MKITRLEILDFQQFKDFAIDLTYPEGHPKAGKPLDKVCLIGQSGTGKTTVLNLIRDVFKNQNKFKETPKNISKNKIISKLNLTNTQTKKGMEIVYHQNGTDVLFRAVPSLKNTEMLKAIYLQTGLENHVSAIIGGLNYPLIRTNEDDMSFLAKLRAIRLSYIEKSCIESQEDFPKPEFRVYLLKELDTYDEKMRLLVNSGADNPQDMHNITKQITELKARNPRVSVAEKLSSLLASFNVKIEVNSSHGGFGLQTLQDKNFEMSLASTGTKHILLSSLPLALLETAHKVILFDEPESSLYPDIQRVIIKHYTDLAPEAQFFFATHSPLIASQFEPWEIVELEFDKEGKVHRKLYYKGENYVDNYTIFPEYLRWDSILTKVFNLGTKGNEKYLIKLKELATLEIKLRNAPKEEKRAIWGKYEKLANLLDWHIEQ